MAAANDCLAGQWSAMVGCYAKSDDLRGLTQFFTTLLPFLALWALALECLKWSPALAVLPLALIILFNVRAFGLMHDCGHGSLFRSRWLNRVAGFLLGVMAGMPQYVWAQHHNYHHAHNGDWDAYRGPYATLSVDEYTSLSPGRQRLYRNKCSVFAAPLAGFIYLIFTPRLTWFKGTVGLALHAIREKLAQPAVPLRTHRASFRTRYWKSAREYRHMSWNNIVLLGLWAAMCVSVGAGRFFAVYLLTVSVAGGLGIVLFTVQHNFEHSYASDHDHWEPDRGVIEGTSFLVLPPWLNWFTVDIGYHHVHHLAAGIPNYRLAECHAQYQHLFTGVTRVNLSGVFGALQCILWDQRAGRIISLAEYRRAGSEGTAIQPAESMGQPQRGP